MALPPPENTLTGVVDGRAFGVKSVDIRREPQSGRRIEITDFSTGCALGTSFDEAPAGSRRLTLHFGTETYRVGLDADFGTAGVSADLAVRRGASGYESRAIVSGHVRILEVQSPGPVDRPAIGKHRAHLMANDGTGVIEGDVVPLEAGCPED